MALTKTACTLVDLGPLWQKSVTSLIPFISRPSIHEHTVFPSESKEVSTLEKKSLPPKCVIFCKRIFMPFSVRWWADTPKNAYGYTSSLCPSPALHNANGLGTLKAWSNKHNAGPHGMWASGSWVVSWMDLCVCLWRSWALSQRCTHWASRKGRVSIWFCKDLATRAHRGHTVPGAHFMIRCLVSDLSLSEFVLQFFKSIFNKLKVGCGIIQVVYKCYLSLTGCVLLSTFCTLAKSILLQCCQYMKQLPSYDVASSLLFCCFWLIVKGKLLQESKIKI